MAEPPGKICNFTVSRCLNFLIIINRIINPNLQYYSNLLSGINFTCRNDQLFSANRSVVLQTTVSPLTTYSVTHRPLDALNDRHLPLGPLALIIYYCTIKYFIFTMPGRWTYWARSGLQAKGDTLFCQTTVRLVLSQNNRPYLK